MGYSLIGGRKRHSSRRHRKQRGGGGASDFVSNTVGGTVGAQISSVFGSSGTSNVIKPLGQSGGGKRHKKQRGGYWAEVVNNAIVPLTLFALNKHAHSKSRKSIFGRGSSRATKRRR
jgi:hypothetical protein